MALRTKVPRVSVERLCALFGMNRQYFYRWRQPDYHQHEMERMLMRESAILRKSSPWLTGRMMYIRFSAIFGKENMPEWERFALLMRMHGMGILKRMSSAERACFSYVCRGERRESLESLNSLESEENRGGDGYWLSDTVDVPLRDGGAVFLHVISDGTTGRVLGWKVADSPHGRHAMIALQSALKREERREEREKMEWDGDDRRGVRICFRRGFQTAYAPLVNLMKEMEIGIVKMGDGIGMGEPPGDKLKRLFLHREEMTEISDVYFALEKGIEFYNGLNCKGLNGSQIMKNTESM